MNPTPLLARHRWTALLLALLAAACGDGAPAGDDAVAERDLPAIEARDTLVLLTAFNSTSYFLYRGVALGFEFEAVQKFANDRDMELRTVVVRDRSELYDRLRSGEGDVVAGRIVPTQNRSSIAFTQPLYHTGAAIVQQEGPPPQVMDTILRRQPVELRARLISEADQLEGEQVHTARGTAPHLRLIELSEELTGDIHVVVVETPTRDEALIQQVANGRIRLAATHENVARLSESRFENLTVQPVVGDTFAVVLAVREGSPLLLQALNEWIAANDPVVSALYEKYFVDRASYNERVASEYLTSETGRLSAYDDVMRRHAPAIGWDWRLLASQMYQESEFNPRAQSWAGAQGLLQLMPPTARQYGVRDPWNPEQNVSGGVRFLAWLQEYWGDKIPDPEQRLRFVLASYNTGHGHVEDARRLAVKNGGSDVVWEDVARWLLQKSKREVYTDPVVRYGFSRGLEPVRYVERILERYQHYREFVRDGAAPASAEAQSGG